MGHMKERTVQIQVRWENFMMSCKLLRCIVRGDHDEAAGNKSGSFKQIVIKAGNFKKIIKAQLFYVERFCVCVCVQYNMMTLSIKSKSQYSDVCMFWGCSETCVDNLISQVLFLLVITPL